MRVLGVDPGVTGAVALYDTAARTLEVYDFPTYKKKVGKKVRNFVDCKLLSNVLVQCNQAAPLDMAFLEANNGRPAGGVKIGAVSIWSMATAQAYAEMGLMANEIPTTMIAPSEWKKIGGVPKDKEAARHMAIQRFPKFSHLFARKMDHNRAEAALLALVGMGILTRATT